MSDSAKFTVEEVSRQLGGKFPSEYDLDAVEYFWLVDGTFYPYSSKEVLSFPPLRADFNVGRSRDPN